MKKFYFLACLIAISIFSIVVFSSCESEEIKPSIVFTDTPPENLFNSELSYATSEKVWVTLEVITSSKVKGSGCLYWNDDAGNSASYNCGTWRIVQSKKYWGMLNGIHYVSNSMDWYTVNEDSYYRIRDAVEKRGIVICNIWKNGRTPWGPENILNDPE
jgi:hypothetical protein